VEEAEEIQSLKCDVELTYVSETTNSFVQCKCGKHLEYNIQNIYGTVNTYQTNVMFYTDLSGSQQSINYLQTMKAYDSVKRKVLHNSLIEFGILMKLVRLKHA
jgi:hypothetical protein